MSYTVNELAAILNGKPEGNHENIKLDKLSRIEDAVEGSITFLSNIKYFNFIHTTKASLVIVNNDLKIDNKIKPVLLRVDDAYNAFTILTQLFQKKTEKTGISEKSSIHKTVSYGNNLFVDDFAVIGEKVVLGNNVKIYAHVYIDDNVVIGDNTVFYAGVKVYKDCLIGSNCKFHAGVVIGSDGFGFAPQQNNTFNKIEQLGNVIIEDDVEIGSNSTIDRAAMGSTIIRKGVKLDNLIQIAHNVEIGENTVIAAQTGISGSTKIGKNCMIGGQVGIVGHLTIGDNVKIAAQSGVSGNLKNNTMVQGSPAFEIRDYHKAYACFKKLPQYFNLFYKMKP